MKYNNTSTVHTVVIVDQAKILKCVALVLQFLETLMEGDRVSSYFLLKVCGPYYYLSRFSQIIFQGEQLVKNIILRG